MGHRFRVAAYGEGSLSFMVMAVDASSLPVPHSALESFGAGFGAASGGATVDLASQVSDVRAGVTYICTPVVGSAGGITAAAPTPTSACIWTDERTTGWVLTYLSSDVSTDLDLAVEIRRGVVSD